jgi:NADH-quinone oxidoreductase subunit L
MVIPLALLSVFAIAFGWIGIPDTFFGTEGVFTSYFHLFVGATIEELMHELYELGLVVVEIKTLAFDPVPVSASFIVALLGLAIGFWIYARRPLKEGQSDPLVRPLGPLYGFLHNKWYWDELYGVIFIRPAVFFSEVVIYEWVDKGLIDGTLHLIARFVFGAARYFKRFEERVISDGVDALKDGVLWVAREFRTIQTGKLQEYALFSLGIATLLALLILAINYRWFEGLFSFIGTIF